MKKALVAVLMALAVGGQAWADEPSDWVKCDGYPRPEGAGMTAARLVAVISTAGLFGLPESTRYAPAALGQEGVDACTRALATGAADNFWARRVSMLQARALHQIEANNHDAALEDLHAATAAAEGQTQEEWYRRSLGVSATLLEAGILVKRGELQAAEALALQAANARPYSATVGNLALYIMAVDVAISAEERVVLDRVANLNPSLRATRVRLLEWSGDDTVAADEYDRLLSLERALRGPEFGPPLAVMARTTIANLRANRIERATALAAELRATLAEPPAPLSQSRRERGAPDPMEIANYRATQRAEATQLMTLVEAYELQRRDDSRGAFAMMTSGRILAEPATLDLIEEIVTGPEFASRAPTMRDAITRLQEAERTRRIEAIELSKFAEALPPLEQVGGGNRFRGQGWGANGYDDRELPGGRSIEFSGGSTITTTEELALLRAAQLARENGFTGFVVRSRSDYQRYYVTTYAGAETSRAPSGFETRMEIRYANVDGAAPELAGSVVNAGEVWDALSPVFNPPRSRR